MWPISEPPYLDCVPLWYQFLILIVDSATQERTEREALLSPPQLYQFVVGPEGLSSISTENIRHALLLWEARSHVTESQYEAATQRLVALEATGDELLPL